MISKPTQWGINRLAHAISVHCTHSGSLRHKLMNCRTFIYKTETGKNRDCGFMEETGKTKPEMETLQPVTIVI